MYCSDPQSYIVLFLVNFVLYFPLGILFQLLQAKEVVCKEVLLETSLQPIKTQIKTAFHECTGTSDLV